MSRVRISGETTPVNAQLPCHTLRTSNTMTATQSALLVQCVTGLLTSSVLVAGVIICSLVIYCGNHLYILNVVRCPYVRNGGRGKRSRQGRHNENGGCERPRRHNENDVIIIIAGLWRYGDWRHVATGCNAVVTLNTCYY